MGVNVAVIGATEDRTKYANRAMKMLRDYGHSVFPVNPHKESIDGEKVYHSIIDIPDQVDTVTLYIRPSILEGIVNEIIEKKPRCVIMNPGTESQVLAETLQDEGITVIRGCTLVMLGTGQF